MTIPTLASVGEDGLLDVILSRIHPHPEVLIGPGDDGAVSRIAGRVVTTADMLVEGEDFLPRWLDGYCLGVKTAAQNLADLYAMGAQPHGLLLSLAAPGTTAVALIDEIVRGVVEEAGRAGAALIGGDLSQAPQLVVAITAIGSLADSPPLLRSGAQVGDDIVCAGQLGHAAAGLDLLFAQCTRPDLDEFVHVQLAPRPEYATAATAVGQAHSLIDVSDGLVSDLGRIARASGVRADLDGQALHSLAAELLPAARALGIEDAPTQALHWLLTGGESHGFVGTMPPGAHPVGWTTLGTVSAGAAGVRIDGINVADSGLPTAGGYRHFVED